MHDPRRTKGSNVELASYLHGTSERAHSEDFVYKEIFCVISKMDVANASECCIPRWNSCA